MADAKRSWRVTHHRTWNPREVEVGKVPHAMAIDRFAVGGQKPSRLEALVIAGAGSGDWV
jgi:hypothetical protein